MGRTGLLFLLLILTAGTAWSQGELALSTEDGPLAMKPTPPKPDAEGVYTVGMGKKVRLAFAAAGLDDGQHMKSHRLRDTFAVELLQRGVPMEEISKLLGHTSMKTTEKSMQSGSKAVKIG